MFFPYCYIALYFLLMLYDFTYKELYFQLIPKKMVLQATFQNHHNLNLAKEISIKPFLVYRRKF